MRRALAAALTAAVCVSCSDEATINSASTLASAMRPPDDPNDPNPPEPTNPDLEPENSPVDPPVIVNGDVCRNDTTVFLRFDGHSCSGVLIRPDLILTAAHCVNHASSAEAINVGIGGQICDRGSTRGVGKRGDPRYDPNDGTANHDVGLVKLANPIEGGVIATVGTFPPYHSYVDIGGFGLDGFDYPQSNLQKCADTRVVGTRNGQITLGRQNGACYGDSGGPVFANGTTRVVGILTNISDGNCQGYTYASPIDQAWLSQAIAELDAESHACSDGATQACQPEGSVCVPLDGNQQAVGTCRQGTRTCSSGAWGACTGYVAPAAEVCVDGLDQNCNGVADDGCAPEPGHPCPPNFEWNDYFQLCMCALTSCPPGLTLDSISCTCSTTCGDGVCQINESRFTCPIDCDNGGGTTCVCGAPAPDGCPPGDPACRPVCGDGVCDMVQEIQGGPYPCAADCDFGGTTCICGWDCPPNTPGCNSGYCGDGQCDLITEDSTSCPWDCDIGGSCICGYDCPPGTPGCDGYCGDGQCDMVSEDYYSCPYDCGGGGGGGSGGGGCGDWDWDWWIDNYGWEFAEEMYATECLAQ